MRSTDAISLPLDADGDFDVATFNASGMTSGVEAVKQGIAFRALLVRGEWFANLAVGVPWFERDGVSARDAILGQPYDETKLANALRAAITSTPGVAAIVSLALAFNATTRTASASYRVRCAFDDVEVYDTIDLGALA